MAVAEVASYIAGAFGFAALGYLVYLAARPDRERHDEDDARAFFDDHGRWPDEPEDAAVPSGSYAEVDLLDRH